MRNSFIIFLLLSLTTCTNIPSNSFELTVDINGIDQNEIVLLSYDLSRNNEWYTITDTGKFINGKFLFDGKIDELTGAFLEFGPSFIRIYMEPSKMELLIDINQPYNYKLSGTKAEKENLEFIKKAEPYLRLNHEMSVCIYDNANKLNSENHSSFVRDSLITILEKCRDIRLSSSREFYKVYYQFASNHTNYQIAPDLLYQTARFNYLEDVDSIKLVYDNLPQQSRNSLMGRLALKKISENTRKLELVNSSLPGCNAPDFSEESFLKDTVRLSNFIQNNFILLDFWASWCGPCLKEVPQIKDFYHKYNNKGLTIIGISCDEDPDSWKEAIDRHQLSLWPQIIDVETDDENIYDLYNVQSIPQYILIDKKGKIAGRWQGEFNPEPILELLNRK